MRRMRTIALFLVSWAAASMLTYELVAKSPCWCGHALPGWHQAQQAEMLTPWTVRTGIKPVDKLIHESEEALHYYHLLPEGTAPRSLHSPLQIPQQS